MDGFDQSCIAPDIDGEPFVDDDGTAYLFWRRRMAARMTDDWQHLTGDTIVMSTARQGYSEGPVMFKRKGIYYYIYTLRGNQNYVNAYMMSRQSPLSGFEKPEGNDIFLFHPLPIMFGGRDMEMYFIMKKQTIIFSYIWSTVTEELPAKYMLIGWNLMRMAL